MGSSNPAGFRSYLYVTKPFNAVVTLLLLDSNDANPLRLKPFVINPRSTFKDAMAFTPERVCKLYPLRFIFPYPDCRVCTGSCTTCPGLTSCTRTLPSESVPFSRTLNPATVSGPGDVGRAVIASPQTADSTPFVPFTFSIKLERSKEAFIHLLNE